MIERVIDWSARNGVLVLLAVLLLVGWGGWALVHTPLDAIPDLSDVQVIVYTEWEGRSPDLIEDQITYPIITSMLGAPRIKTVRGQSFLGVSFVYIIFEDGTDIYWARSRVVEYLQGVTGKLPEGLSPRLGPDATGVGWVFQYALVDESGQHDLAELRTFQDWYLRYWLQSVPGVAEVASIGGFVKQYQVQVDPTKLLGYRLSLKQLIEAIRQSNNDVGGRVLEIGEREYMVRGRGYIQSLDDIRRIAVATDRQGTPITVQDLGVVTVGPDMRRGVAELDGRGETVGGIIIMRYGENALAVIDRVTAKLREITPSLPQSMRIIPVYDRSQLIHAAIATLKEKLIEVSVVVCRRQSGLSVSRTLGSCGHCDPAGGDSLVLSRHVYTRDHVEHHVLSGHRHRHRRDGGCRHRDDRECAQAAGAVGAGWSVRLQDRSHHPCRSGSGQTALFFVAHHHHFFSAGLCT